KDGARLLACGDDERRAIPVRGEDVAHRMPHTYGGMEIDECRVTSRLRIAVRHPHDDRLLQAEDVAEVLREVPEQRQLGRAWVAEDRRDPEGAQQVEDNGPDGHRSNDIYPFRTLARSSSRRSERIHQGPLESARTSIEATISPPPNLRA